MEMGIPCGGKMAVIVEPQLSAPVMLIRGMGRVAEVLATLGDMLNYQGYGANFCRRSAALCKR